MKKKVLIVDTCLACVWLKVPGMEVAGSDSDRWDYKRVNEKLQSEIKNGTLLVFPMASIIETGNHITQIKDTDRMPYISDLAGKINDTIDGKFPWAIFNSQNKLWEGEHLREVVQRWVQLNQSAGKHSIGDVSILDVATAYREAGFGVEILTADSLLKAYESVSLSMIGIPEPRRRKREK